MKLFTKYNRINLTVMIAVFIISGAVYYGIINLVLIHELDDTLKEYKERLEEYVGKNDALPVFKNFEEVDVNYHVIPAPVKKKYSLVRLYDPEEHRMGMFRQLIFTQKVKGKLYEINIDKPLEGTKLLTLTIVFTTLGMMLAIILISILVNQLILRKLWHPFYATINQLRGFKLGNKVMPSLPETDIEEFSFMNHTLSEVINSAKDDYRILKEFTENASHEMQTPLAIMRSKLDLVIQEEGLSESQSDALKSIYSGIHRLAKLNQSLLLLAKIENLQYGQVELIDMEERVREKLDQFKEFWMGNGIDVITVLDHSSLIINPELIEILLNNLLSNAGRHNVKGGNITIKLKAGLLQISNTGNGKPLDKLKLFNRFYKEAQHSQHNGLGLSIVKQICDQSGVKIQYHFADEQHHFVFYWDSLTS
ncbi:HAMP domain-containing sensor histidine kinase [Pedobacter sp. L105]|uniref:sensor histidine kinase n=1 Tax=Pedobacter sp. L105 TaxID=1641871 RepID=UPI00131B7376|nr:HAMP domain-containing sensor histidine kinase [Pedobacter sp. L105]